MKQKWRSVTGVLFCLMLVASLFPVISLAAEPEKMSLDLREGSVNVTEDQSAMLRRILEEAAAQKLINQRVVSGEDIRYDLNRDGVNDLGYMKQNVQVGKATVMSEVFLPLSAATVFGDVTLSVPSSDTLEKGAEVTLQFPLRTIQVVELTGVRTALTAGETPEFTAKLSTDSDRFAEIRAEIWTDLNDDRELSSADTKAPTATAGHTYSYRIVLAAKDGYVFEEPVALVYRGEKLDGKNYQTSVSKDGKTLELSGFLADVDVIVDALDELTIDLTEGTVSLPQTRSIAVGSSLTAASETGQIQMNAVTGTVDLDKDGNDDLALSYDTKSRTNTLKVLTDSMSLSRDYVLNLSAASLEYLTEHKTSPYVKTITFRFQSSANTFALDLREESAVVKGEDLSALVNTLLADAAAGRIGLTQNNEIYDLDLDNDGRKDVRLNIALDGSQAEVIPLETASLPEETDLVTPLGQTTVMTAAGDPFFTRLTVLMTPTQPAQDLGDVSLDLSKGTDEKTAEMTEGILASLTALEKSGRVKSRMEGTMVYYDLDLNGDADLQADKKAGGTAIFALTDTCSLTRDAAFTLTEAERASVDDAHEKSYVRSLTVQIPEALKTLSFTDTLSDAFYYDAVKWAVDKGVTTGTSETTFSPDQTCTRAQVVTFLWRGAGSPAPATLSNPFTDVTSDDYFYQAVLWAVEKEITKGTSETTFGPEESCTRAQVVTFLHRYEGSPATISMANPFLDVTAGEYYYTPVLWAVEQNITKGTWENAFSPADSCTRGQIVTFLYRDLAK